jgi:hypothetical protein
MPKNKIRKKSGLEAKDYASSWDKAVVLEKHLNDPTAKKYMSALTEKIINANGGDTQITPDQAQHLAQTLMLATLTAMHDKKVYGLIGSPFDASSSLNEWTIMEGNFSRKILPIVNQITSNITTEMKAQTKNFDQPSIAADLPSVQQKALFEFLKREVNQPNLDLSELITQSVRLAVADEIIKPQINILKDEVRSKQFEGNAAVELDTRIKAITNLNSEGMKEFYKQSPDLLASIRSGIHDINRQMQKIDNAKPGDTLDRTLEMEIKQAAAFPKSPTAMVNEISSRMTKLVNILNDINGKIAAYDKTIINPKARETLASLKEQLAAVKIDIVRDTETLNGIKTNNSDLAERVEINKRQLASLNKIVGASETKINNLTEVKPQKITIPKAFTAQVAPSQDTLNKLRSFGLERFGNMPQTPKPAEAAPTPSQSTKVTTPPPAKESRELSGVSMKRANTVQPPEAKAETIITPQAKRSDSPEPEEKNQVFVTPLNRTRNIKLDKISTGKVHKTVTDVNIASSAEVKQPETPSTPPSPTTPAAPTASVTESQLASPEIVSPAASSTDEKKPIIEAATPIPDAPPLTAEVPSSGTRRINIERRQGRFVPPKIDAFENRGKIITEKRESAAVAEARMLGVLRHLNELQSRDFNKISQGEVDIIHRLASEAIEASRIHADLKHLIDTINTRLTSLDQKMVAGLEAKDAAEQAAEIQPEIKIELGEAPNAPAQAGVFTAAAEKLEIESKTTLEQTPENSTIGSVNEEKFDAITRNSEALNVELQDLLTNSLASNKSLTPEQASTLKTITQRFSQLESDLGVISVDIDPTIEMGLVTLNPLHAQMRDAITTLTGFAVKYAEQSEEKPTHEEEVIQTPQQDEEKEPAINRGNRLDELHQELQQLKDKMIDDSIAIVSNMGSINAAMDTTNLVSVVDKLVSQKTQDTQNLSQLNKLLTTLDTFSASIQPVNEAETQTLNGWQNARAEALEMSKSTIEGADNLILAAFADLSNQINNSVSLPPAGFEFTQEIIDIDSAHINSITAALSAFESTVTDEEKIGKITQVRIDLAEAMQALTNQSSLLQNPNAKTIPPIHELNEINMQSATPKPTTTGEPETETETETDAEEVVNKNEDKPSILRKLTAEQEKIPPNPYLDLPHDAFKIMADRILDSKDLKRSATLLDYFEKKIIESRDPNATNLGMREKLISDWNEKLFPLLERVDTRVKDLSHILDVLEAEEKKPDNSRIKAAQTALDEITEFREKLYGKKGVRDSIQKELDKYGLDAIKINAYAAVIITRKEGQTAEDFQAEIKRHCNALHTEDKPTSDGFNMKDKDFSVKLASQAAVVLIKGLKEPEGFYIEINLPHLLEEKNTSTVYSVQSGNNFSSSEVTVHHLRADLKLNDMLLFACLKGGLGERLPNPNPETSNQRTADLLSSYKEHPFSQKGLEKFLEVKVKRGELELPKPIAGMLRTGPTCRSMASDIYGRYTQCVRDPSNPDLPAPKTLEIALQVMRDFINSNRGSCKIPVSNTQNAEINRAVQLICEVMKRSLTNSADRYIFEYKAVGLNNHEDYSRNIFQRDLIGAVQKSLMKIDKDFVTSLSVQNQTVKQVERNRDVQTTTFNLATTENKSRVPTPEPDEQEQRHTTPGPGRRSSGG